MQNKHFVILGMLLTAISLQLGGLEHWADATNPKFLAGLLLAVGTVLTAMFSEKPSTNVTPLPSVTKPAPPVKPEEERT